MLTCRTCRDKFCAPLVVGQVPRPVLRGLPIDGAFDDYHGGLVGIGRDPEQAPLQTWTTNRATCAVRKSPTRSCRDLLRCAAFTRQVVEPFSKDTPGTDVADQDVQRGPTASRTGARAPVIVSQSCQTAPRQNV
jgi:hypothetical protein